MESTKRATMLAVRILDTDALNRAPTDILHRGTVAHGLGVAVGTGASAAAAPGRPNLRRSRSTNCCSTPGGLPAKRQSNHTHPRKTTAAAGVIKTNCHAASNALSAVPASRVTS
jgi:hypothetical protein